MNGIWFGICFVAFLATVMGFVTFVEWLVPGAFPLEGW